MYIVINTQVSNGKQKVEINSIEEGVKVWVSHRNGNNDACEFIGASDMKHDCCSIYDNGQKIAEIAYNGKIRN